MPMQAGTNNWNQVVPAGGREKGPFWSYLMFGQEPKERD